MNQIALDELMKRIHRWKENGVEDFYQARKEFIHTWNMRNQFTPNNPYPYLSEEEATETFAPNEVNIGGFWFVKAKR